MFIDCLLRVKQTAIVTTEKDGKKNKIKATVVPTESYITTDAITLQQIIANF
jgi:hypothetical protein